GTLGPLFQDPDGGKSGPKVPTVKKGISQDFTILATDQYFNPTTYTGGKIKFVSDDTTVAPGNPTVFGDQLTTGNLTASVKFNLVGTRYIQAIDENKAGVSDTVNLIVDGASYKITVANASNLIAAQTFSVNIELR